MKASRSVKKCQQKFCSKLMEMIISGPCLDWRETIFNPYPTWLKCIEHDSLFDTFVFSSFLFIVYDPFSFGALKLMMPNGLSFCKIFHDGRLFELYSD